MQQRHSTNSSVPGRIRCSRDATDRPRVPAAVTAITNATSACTWPSRPAAGHANFSSAHLTALRTACSRSPSCASSDLDLTLTTQPASTGAHPLQACSSSPPPPRTSLPPCGARAPATPSLDREPGHQRHHAHAAGHARASSCARPPAPRSSASSLLHQAPPPPPEHLSGNRTRGSSTGLHQPPGRFSRRHQLPWVLVL